jgi:hypothetical protein
MQRDFVTDHPVRALSERDHFICGAATPPWQGGENAPLNPLPRYSGEVTPLLNLQFLSVIGPARPGRGTPNLGGELQADASRHFIDVGFTVIHSHVLTPWAKIYRRFAAE